MPITYANRKAQTYYLCRGFTRTGKPRYYFAREPKGDVVEKIPDGYQVQESVNGIVSLARIRPSLLSNEEIAAVEAAVQNHSQAKRYRVSVKSNQITVHERVGLDMAETAVILGIVLSSNALARYDDNRGQYQPIMRFTLTDSARRLFKAERMCFRASIDGWIDIEYDQRLPLLSAKYVPTLGTDEFFELYYGM